MILYVSGLQPMMHNNNLRSNLGNLEKNIYFLNILAKNNIYDSTLCHYMYIYVYT